MPTVSRGSVYRQPGTQKWTIKFYVDGKPVRESTGFEDEGQARALLERRVAEVRTGRWVPIDKRPSWSEMESELLANYAYKRNRTDPRHHLKPLREFFGPLSGDQIDETSIKRYGRQRLTGDGVSPATLHRELSVFKRLLRLSSHRLPRVPVIDMPRVDNARQGFFEEDELQAILPHLPEHARPVVEFLYLTGWRSGEAFRLHWSDVDWHRKFVHLRNSKNREPRIFPFKYHARLEHLLREQRRAVTGWELEHGRICPTVFHWRGNPIGKLRRSWKRACVAAGMPDRLLHDFRRTAVRNLIRAGVQQAIAMKITGHKTGAIFRRYLIVDEELLAAATGAVADMLETNAARDRDNKR